MAEDQDKKLRDKDAEAYSADDDRRKEARALAEFAAPLVEKNTPDPRDSKKGKK